MLGLLSRVEHKTLANDQNHGETWAARSECLLDSARWDADAVRHDLRGFVAFHRGEEESGVLIAEEIGFPKTGEKSVEVACRYTGAAGKKENTRAGCSWVRLREDIVVGPEIPRGSEGSSATRSNG